MGQKNGWIKILHTLGIQIKKNPIKDLKTSPIFLFFGDPFLHNSEAFMNWSLKSTTILYKSPNFRQSGGYLQILYSIFLLVSKWFLPPRNGLKYKYSKKTTLDLQRQILYYTNKRASHWICSCIISSSASINLLQQLLLQKKISKRR